jgi:bacillithiol synthase
VQSEGLRLRVSNDVSHMSESSTLSGRSVAFERLKGFSALFNAYCTDFERVASFFATDFRSADQRSEAAARAAAHPRDRKVLVEVLREQNARWGADDLTRSRIESLLDPESVAVVTGQQLGLFTGPLYTLLKSLSTLQLAERLAAETGRPVVPVFWLEGEDHDFEEVASVSILRDNEPRTLTYRPEGSVSGPIGGHVLDAGIGEVIDGMAETLRETEFTAGLLASVREAYRPGETMADAFARFMRTLLPEAGLVLLCPADARLKRLAAPLFRREVAEAPETRDRVRGVSELLAIDFHAQARPRDVNLFYLGNGSRERVELTEQGFGVGTGDPVSETEILEMIDREPERFSPNVILRPLYQDTLLPTAAYVAGPGEIAYFAQLRPVYEWAGVPMPAVVPRATATLVERKVHRVLEKYDIAFETLQGGTDEVLSQVAEARRDEGLDRAFADASGQMHEAMNRLRPEIERVERSLVNTAEATRAAIARELEKLETRARRADKRRHDELRDQIDKAVTNLFPEGALQERKLASLYFLNKYGPNLASMLRAGLDTDLRAHQIVDLGELIRIS